MPVEKLDGALLRKQDMGFDIVSREAVEKIENPIAMALFLLMATRPPNWIFRRDWLLKRLGVSRKLYDPAMNELRELGFVTSATVRNENGMVAGRVIWFTQEITEGPSGVLSEASPKVPVGDRSPKPKVPVGYPLKNRDYLNNKEDIENKEYMPAKEDFLAGVDEQAWQDWNEYRTSTKTLKKNWNVLAKKKVANKLKGYPPEEQREMVDRAISSGWSSVFPREKKDAPRNHFLGAI